VTLKQTRIGTRLGIGFGVVLMLLAIIAGLGVMRLASLNQSVATLADHRVINLEVAYEWSAHLQDTAVRMRNILLVNDPQDIAQELEAIRKDQQLRLQALNALTDSITLPEGKAKLAAVVAARAAYVPNEDRFLEHIAAGNKSAANEILVNAVRPTQLANIEALQHLVEFEKRAVEDDRHAAALQYTDSRNVMLIITALALAVGVAAATYITRDLLRKLGGEPEYAAAIASSIAAGQLDIEINIKPGDQSSLLAAMQAMRDSLLQIVTKVRTAADAVQHGTQQLSEGNDNLNLRTQEQASALEETAASMEQMTASVKQNADNTRQTTQRALDVRAQAERGGTVVNRAVAAMSGINASSKKIADIIGVIDEIAFQTNLLALNAAVEAARAGEQGRGFAVVATEVRNLAQRSASAAKQIKQLITDSVEKVREGSELVDESGKSLSLIIQSVSEVADIVTEMSAASREQATGIDQVNTAITQMDSVTQQNAALVEEATATSKAIEQQTAELVQLIAYFHTGAAVTPPNHNVTGESSQQSITRLTTRPRRASNSIASFKRVAGQN
jgi:methyl-accepting chemotaxis protein